MMNTLHVAKILKKFIKKLKIKMQINQYEIELIHFTGRIVEVLLPFRSQHRMRYLLCIPLAHRTSSLSSGFVLPFSSVYGGKPTNLLIKFNTTVCHTRLFSSFKTQ